MLLKNFKIISLFLLSIILMSCAVNPVTGQRQFMLMSENQEIDMGKEFYPGALWGDPGGGGEYKDEKLKAYLRDIIIHIHAVSHRPNLPVDFAIQNSSVPNAWAIPGHVVITRGLLAALDNEAEFVFVMGHEMGHVSARHSARHMTYGILQQAGLGAAGYALQGVEYADLAMNLGAIGSSLLLLKYSRDDELEADRLGLLYMGKLGYNPQNAVSAHRDLEKVSQEYMKKAGKNSQEGGFLGELLSTHPRSSVRIDELQSLINSMQPARISGDGTYRDRFQGMITGLKNTNKIYDEYYDRAVREVQNKKFDEADTLISKAINTDNRQPVFHALKGFILMKKKDYAGSRKAFESSLDLDRDYEPAYRGIGTLLFLQENFSESIAYLNKSIALFPQDVVSHYFTGMSYYKVKMYKDAIPHLKIFSEAQSKDPEIHGILGICYENEGDLSSAYNEYFLQLKVAPDNETGRYAATREKALRNTVGQKVR
jgi:predicted Zn-dependent protease